MSQQHVLFAHAFFLVHDQKQLQEKYQPYPPLATLYAASVAREAGYRVSLFDAVLADGMGDFSEQLHSTPCNLLVIYEDDFNFLTKMCLTHVRDATFDMMQLAAARDIPVVVHSSDASDRPDLYLDKGASYVVSGEGEQTLRELIPFIFESGDTSPLPNGVITRTGDDLYVAPRRSNARNIDHLPFPAWDLVDLARYRDAWRDRHGYFSLNLVSSRGCPYRCNWCAKPIWGQQYVRFSPEYVARQVHWLKQHANPDQLWFSDDIFGLNRDWLAGFLSAIEALDAVIPYKMQSRADLIDAELAHKLYRSGCREIWLGVESGSQQILDAMDKELTLSQVTQAKTYLDEAGIEANFFIQLGYPGEELSDLEATRRMIMELRPGQIGVSVSYPLPGTDFYQHVQEQIREKTNWEQSNDLDAVFTSTFSADFYRLVRDHLHAELRDLTTQGTDIDWDRRWQELLQQSSQYLHSDVVDVIYRAS